MLFFLLIIVFIFINCLLFAFESCLLGVKHESLKFESDSFETSFMKFKFSNFFKQIKLIKFYKMKSNPTSVPIYRPQSDSSKRQQPQKKLTPIKVSLPAKSPNHKKAKDQEKNQSETEEGWIPKVFSHDSPAHPDYIKNHSSIPSSCCWQIYLP